ncbi:glutamate--tRNA ligase [Anderseniella sp. Alg231-50]|uniref:glutamate--tRNA ligase n=1 Tax=Anderseniella sp. Alg231-50 TaxID=1922226 RepID=UPI000D55E4FC
MTITVRFAPSPTGRIHIGNARTAILNWLFARKAQGRFILRFDDTDLERSTKEFADGITTDLNWLGLTPDEVYRQSERFALYDAAAEKLKSDGRLYACYESAEELDYKRKRQLARHQPPIYDRTGLNLSDEDRAKLEAEGGKPHWRFKLDQRDIHWDDLVRGEVHIDTSSLSDPVLIREDGSYLYTLPSVVDDIDMGLTHVIRGEDHTTNAAVQVEIFEALGAKPPAFAHHSLLVGADGKGLSKRLGSLSVAAMREDGLEAMAVVSHGALIGTSEAIEPHTRMDTLLEAFDLSKLSRAPGRFDMIELENLNARIVHQLSYSDVRERLADMGADGGEDFWQAVHSNLSKVRDAAEWHGIVCGHVTGEIADEDREFISQAAGLLPEEPWDDTSWKTWTDAVKQATGRKGKGLFMPLRLALTGKPHGPELAVLLPLIGRDRTLARL